MPKLPIAILMMSLASLARADAVGYSGILDCRAESELLSAEHHHDWSEATHAARWEMISTTKDVFTSNNSYASLVVRNKQNHAQLFRVPTPALTQLWISNDSGFIVGISNIKLWNPVQVVVFNSQGALVLAKSVDSSSFPGVSESASNWVHWYKEPQPRISIESKGDSYSLHIEGNNGVDRVFMIEGVRQ
jgi:hypothetical protein